MASLKDRLQHAWNAFTNPFDRELYHYASPYYDPVKAHECYEQHKQLKGRSSTAGLNEKGREVARYGSVTGILLGDDKSLLSNLAAPKITIQETINISWLVE